MLELFKRGMHYISAIVTLLISVLLAVEFVFATSFENQQLFYVWHFLILLYLSVDIILRLGFRRIFPASILRRVVNLSVLIPFGAMFILGLEMGDMYGVVQFIFAMIVLVRLEDIGHVIEMLRVQPTQLFVLGFLVLIFIGALLLSLPVARTGATPIPFLDAVFTATSALCVTGLVLHDVGSYFSGFGQGVILLLIQLGGLGIMTFYALMMLVLGSKVSRNQSIEYQEALATEGVSETFALIKSIFIYTFIVELIGATLLFFVWKDGFSTVWEAVVMSVFHSISAFCNAGFSLFSDSLASFSTNFSVLGIISGLIIVGGIGFPVIFNLRHHYFKRPKERLKVQTKLPLLITLILIVFGTLAIYMVERNGVLIDFSLAEQVMLSFFHSVSARSAGFNALDLGSFSVASLLVVTVLMFIGSSPGSTGGGIKTTTFGIIHVALLRVIQGDTKMSVFGRSISPLNVYRALSIFFISVIIVFTGIFSLLLHEVFAFVPLMFEAVSAFGTAGLSMGVTSGLSSMGKVSIICLMFIGRLGPLTLGIALAKRKQQSNYTFPEERILLG